MESVGQALAHAGSRPVAQPVVSTACTSTRAVALPPVDHPIRAGDTQYPHPLQMSLLHHGRCELGPEQRAGRTHV